MKKSSLTLFLVFSALFPTTSTSADVTNADQKMVLEKTINGDISPKSVLASDSGLVSAHNMMYRHSVTIYDANKSELIATIPDSVVLSDFGFKKYSGTYKGAPVEGAFSPDGKYLYYTNYSMYGKGFTKEGHDTCSPASGYDNSFLSRINLESMKVDAVYPVGSVPKVVQVTPDNKYILVSNWCSYSVTVISIESGKTIKSIKIGKYPRGIAITKDSQFAYVAEMGGSQVHRINLENFTKTVIPVGTNPRAIVLSPDETKMYITMNLAGKVQAWDLIRNTTIKSVKTGEKPRSLDISSDGSALFVVNFNGDTLSKVRTSDMKVLQTIKVCNEPIGVSFDSSTNRTWVACYGGSLKVFANQS
jgi:YVTN family beta-propeller protein